MINCKKRREVLVTKEEQFWSRFLELAQLQLKDSAYDFFVADSKLVKVDGDTATIYLDGNYKMP